MLIAKEVKISPQAVSGLYSSSRRFPAATAELKSFFFAASQLPGWMKKPDVAETVDAIAASNVNPAEGVEIDEGATAERVQVLPMLGSLPEPLGPPIVETEENEAPVSNEANPSNEALNQSIELTVESNEANPANAALNQSSELTVETNEAEKPRSMQLANAFNQAEAYKRQLQEQNIYKLDGGTYAQAVPDGKGGGIIMRPVDLSQVKSKQEGVGSMIGTMTANALQVQMDTLARATTELNHSPPFLEWPTLPGDFALLMPLHSALSFSQT